MELDQIPLYSVHLVVDHFTHVSTYLSNAHPLQLSQWALAYEHVPQVCVIDKHNAYCDDVISSDFGIGLKKTPRYIQRDKNSSQPHPSSLL